MLADGRMENNTERALLLIQMDQSCKETGLTERDKKEKKLEFPYYFNQFSIKSFKTSYSIKTKKIFFLNFLDLFLFKNK